MIFPLKIGILALYQVPLLQRSQISLQHGRVRKKLSRVYLPFLSLSLSSSHPPHFPLNLTKCAYINTRQLRVAAKV